MSPIKKVNDPLKQHPQLKKIIFNEDPSLTLDEDDWPNEMR